MDFGIGFWVLFLIIFFGCGKMCGWGVRRYRGRPRELDSGDDQRDHRLANLESRIRRLGDRDRTRERLTRPATFRHGEGEEAEHARMRERRTTPLQTLQQKFVEGRLTLTEYERELDRLERIE